MNYEYANIEAKWQKYWEDNQTFRTDVWDFSKPKYYVLDMFPYPSGVGLHAGHPEGYTATDIMSRMKRMQGYNVLHPMGYDSFGLPAEQYAVDTGNHPADLWDPGAAGGASGVRSGQRGRFPAHVNGCLHDEAAAAEPDPCAGL